MYILKVESSDEDLDFATSSIQQTSARNTEKDKPKRDIRQAGQITPSNMSGYKLLTKLFLL